MLTASNARILSHHSELKTITDFVIDLTIVSPFVGVRKGNLGVANGSSNNPDFEANEAARRSTSTQAPAATA